ncbi:MAG: DUF1343 domain-containing protein [Clostridia bacterium]|nr:DUF1343 domain-containing protein [Clostridia bacterium]
MRKLIVFLLLITVVTVPFAGVTAAPKVKLGNEVLLEQYRYLIEGKRIGLVTNQTGVDSQGRSLIDILAADPSLTLAALYAPEHGIDGKAAAGAYVESYTHPALGIPVYSLYGATRKPTATMLENIDVLLFDIQDIGARTYTYMSTMNYVIEAGARFGKPVIILDRPNPLGGLIVDGPMMEDPYISFVGIDNLPMAHGMTAGELALFFNRKLGADLTVIPMEGWTRDMIFQDTGLPWKQTSPNIPDLVSCFGYMATGLGEGTGIYLADKFKWIGGKGIDAQRFADLMNNAGLPGVRFIPEYQGQAGGIRLDITDYHKFNPAKTGIYALTYAKHLTDFKVPKSGDTVVMFDKIMGTAKIGQGLEQKLYPAAMEALYAKELEQFKQERQKYLLYGPYPSGSPANGQPAAVKIFVKDKELYFDVPPYLDENNRLLVPFRPIAAALGASVNWLPQTRQVTMVGQGQILLLTINSNRAIVNGETVSMDTTPIIKDGRTLVPVRYVGEFLRSTVDWHQQEKVVNIY